MVHPNQLLTTRQASRFLGVSASFLERDRWAGAKIPFVRIGKRAVRYQLSDLEAFVSQRVRLSTSQAR